MEHENSFRSDGNLDLNVSEHRKMKAEFTDGVYSHFRRADT